MVPVTPRGFRDVLPNEAAWRESIEKQVQACFSSWGYMPIETPTLEVLEVLEEGGAAGRVISLFDTDGRLLALRPDVTLPIARMVASRLDEKLAPFRFRYTQQVFRDAQDLRAQAREYTQFGIEAIGLSGSYADAEVVSVFVEALKAAGLKQFTVAVCTVGVLRALIDNAGMDEGWKNAVLKAFHTSNFVEIEQLVAYEGVKPGFGKAICALPHLRGGKEAIVACKQMVEALGCPADLDSLAQTWDLIEAAGVSEQVVVDFSVMSSFDYYTGLVMEAYAPGIGQSLGSGGRYDHMLEAFGCDLPAAGFAFCLEYVMQALSEQGEKTRKRTPDALIGGSDMQQVFKQAAVLRAKNRKVCITANSDIAKEAQRRGIPSACEVQPDGQLCWLRGE